jgi:multiple sugar transport system ATP-binding protein
MEDASLVADAPVDRRLRSTVDLREALGSDVVVHFGIDAPQAVTEHVRELAADAGDDLPDMRQGATGRGSTVLARLNPRTAVTKGDNIELVVDVQRLHFFDPDNGQGIYEEN